MFCLFYTIPAEDNSGKVKNTKRKKYSITRSLVTWSLVFVWGFLIVFGLVMATNPSWMKDFTEFGRAGESRQVKDLGDAFLRDRNYQMALGQYEHVLKIKPDYTGAIVNSAIAYNQSGYPEKGIELLQEAFRHDPKHIGTINFNIGEIYHDMKQYEKAAEYYRKSIGTELDPNLTYKKLLTLYMQTKQYENAHEVALKLLEIQDNPLTPFMNMLYKYSTIYEGSPDHYSFFENMFAHDVTIDQLSEYDLETINNLNDSDPEIAKTHNNLAIIYAVEGNLDKAIEHFELSEKIWPGNIDAVKNLKILRQAKSDSRLAVTAK